MPDCQSIVLSKTYSKQEILLSPFEYFLEFWALCCLLYERISSVQWGCNKGFRFTFYLLTRTEIGYCILSTFFSVSISTQRDVKCSSFCFFIFYAHFYPLESFYHICAWCLVLVHNGMCMEMFLNCWHCLFYDFEHFPDLLVCGVFMRTTNINMLYNNNRSKLRGKTSLLRYTN